MRPAGVALALLALAAAAAGPSLPAGAADPVEAEFRRGCLEGGRAALKASETWAWIEELCGRGAAEDAAAFRVADREGRLVLLAADYAAWHADNVWRLPERLQRDARTRRAYVEATCRSEAEARLRRLEGP